MQRRGRTRQLGSSAALGISWGPGQGAVPAGTLPPGHRLRRLCRERSCGPGRAPFAWLSSSSVCAFPTFPRTLFCPGHPPSQGLTCRCQGSCWGQVPRQRIPVPSLLCRDLVAQLPGLGVGRAARGNGASPGGVGTRAGIPSALTWRPTAVRHPAICWAVTGNCSSIAVRHQGRVPWVPIPSLGAQGVGAALMPFLACLGWLQAAVVRQRGVVVPTGRHQQRQRVPRSHWVQEGLASLTCPPLSSLPLQPQPIEGCRGQC